MKLADGSLRNGVVAQSTGNHGQGLALAAKLVSVERGFHIPAYIVLPEIATSSKIDATRDYGGEVYFSGYTLPERQKKAYEVQKNTGATMIAPFGNCDVMLGQGTAIYEFKRQMEEEGLGSLASVIVPCGSGSLLTGTAIACKNTSTRVFGAEPSEGGADDVVRGLKLGKRIGSVQSLTIADGLRSPVGESNWEIIKRREYVEGVFSATEEHIKSAMKLVLEWAGVLIEPSAALPLAILLYNREFQNVYIDGMSASEENIGIILSGGNTTVEKIKEIWK
ncbi:uncharacterized protein PV09_01935 [Verruconis gallopava]|uniref:Tryptophan synthase beta chain-like PALP domain-containing protein n=1 Tax=Verruconis gallopava TaxID=253628 RepID=A0A0D1Z2A0_9PEZI|nr:uncharacterized protein PV09_01935 [Verruconis gallopava]KIW07042.1 hypothetical protein PV09_01935 [Verruconis gallopava]